MQGTTPIQRTTKTDRYRDDRFETKLDRRAAERERQDRREAARTRKSLGLPS